MRKFFFALLLLGIVAVAGCKKNDNNEQANSILAGKWNLTKIHNIYIDSNQHVIRDTMMDVSRYNNYIRFNTNSTGMATVSEAFTASGAFSDVAVDGKFNYKISGQNLTIDYLNGGSLSRGFTLGDNNELVIKRKAHIGGITPPEFRNLTLDQTEYYSK